MWTVLLTKKLRPTSKFFFWKVRKQTSVRAWNTNQYMAFCSTESKVYTDQYQTKTDAWGGWRAHQLIHSSHSKWCEYSLLIRSLCEVKRHYDPSLLHCPNVLVHAVCKIFQVAQWKVSMHAEICLPSINHVQCLHDTCTICMHTCVHVHSEYKSNICNNCDQWQIYFKCYHVSLLGCRRNGTKSFTCTTFYSWWLCLNKEIANTHDTSFKLISLMFCSNKGYALSVKGYPFHFIIFPECLQGRTALCYSYAI